VLESHKGSGREREREEEGHVGHGSGQLLGWLPWAQMNSYSFHLFKHFKST
jgi:hypothetical protein